MSHNPPRIASLRGILLILMVLGGLTTAPLASGAATVGLFDYIEKPYSGLKPFPKWRKVLQHFMDAPGPCVPDVYNRCAYQKWKALIEDWKKLPREEQLKKVNRHMNLFRYILDPINWGVKDYWEIPKEFFARFGDCEDYAIAKYFTLRALGWPAKDMKIVVLQDMNLGIAHAILAVYYKGKDLILDNQIPQVVDARRIHHYRPIYSVNELGWWRHFPPSAVAQGTARARGQAD